MSDVPPPPWAEIPDPPPGPPATPQRQLAISLLAAHAPSLDLDSDVGRRCVVALEKAAEGLSRGAALAFGLFDANEWAAVEKAAPGLGKAFAKATGFGLAVIEEQMLAAGKATHANVRRWRLDREDDGHWSKQKAIGRVADSSRMKTWDEIFAEADQ